MDKDEQAAQRLQRMVDDAHIDAQVHPDPCGGGLIRLIHAIETHASEEERAIQDYAPLAEGSPDPSIKVVMRMLLEEEQRHHRQFLTIANSLRERLNWIPSPSWSTDNAGEGWAPRVRAFEVEERRGAEELRELAHSARREGDGLGALLLEAMALDSEKHARLLLFVAHRLSNGGDQLISDA